MTDTEKKIAEIREALENCTFPANERLIFVESEEDETTYEIVTERGVVIAKGLDPYDAYLFANAPEWLRFLIQAVEMYRELMHELDKENDHLHEKINELEKLKQERDKLTRGCGCVYSIMGAGVKKITSHIYVTS